MSDRKWESITLHLDLCRCGNSVNNKTIWGISQMESGTLSNDVEHYNTYHSFFLFQGFQHDDDDDNET